MSHTTEDEHTDDESLIMHDDFYQEELKKIINEVTISDIIKNKSCELPGKFTWIKGFECGSKENPVCMYCNKST
jgi:hypothetical protein